MQGTVRYQYHRGTAGAPSTKQSVNGVLEKGSPNLLVLRVTGSALYWCRRGSFLDLVLQSCCSTTPIDEESVLSVSS